MQKLTALLLLVVSYTTSAQKLFLNLSESSASTPASPVRVQLSQPLDSKTSYQLQNQKTRKAIPAQLLDSTTLIYMPEPNLPIGNHVYSLIASQQNMPSPVSIEKKENGLLVKVRSKPVLFYHIMEAMPPADSPAYYRRSGFIHPLYSPSGKILTDDFPVDHTHQHGIFFAWTNTTFKNSPVDFWNQHSKKGTVEHIEVLEVTDGPIASRIKTMLRHRSLEHGEVLKERWTLTIYPIAEYFLFDLESEQQNTTADTFFLNKYMYGGLAFRGSGEWNEHDKGKYTGKWSILTSEGYRDTAANHTRARWVHASGKVGGTIAGAAVFNHPENYRYPQAIRVHPQMPYWTYAPVVDAAFYIAPGAFYRSNFRYYVHDGEVQKEFLEKLFKEWTTPSNVKVTYR